MEDGAEELRGEPRVALRVEELAAASGVGVDTIRFYQGRGLLEPPRHRGRIALYGPGHLERLRRIRALQARGFSLAQIRRVLARPTAASDPLLAALVDEGVERRTLSRSELAEEAGVPEALVEAAVHAHLLEPLRVEGRERFGESDLEMARAGRALLDAGFPLPALLEHAVSHAEHVRATCDAAVELFNEHVRRPNSAADPRARSSQAVAEAFRGLLPLVTRLVAVHFQRTLVTRALERLDADERSALQEALAEAGDRRLDAEGTWR